MRKRTVNLHSPLKCGFFTAHKTLLHLSHIFAIHSQQIITLHLYRGFYTSKIISKWQQELYVAFALGDIWAWLLISKNTKKKHVTQGTNWSGTFWNTVVQSFRLLSLLFYCNITEKRVHPLYIVKVFDNSGPEIHFLCQGASWHVNPQKCGWQNLKCECSSIQKENYVTAAVFLAIIFCITWRRYYTHTMAPNLLDFLQHFFLVVWNLLGGK